MSRVADIDAWRVVRRERREREDAPRVSACQRFLETVFVPEMRRRMREGATDLSVEVYGTKQLASTCAACTTYPEEVVTNIDGGEACTAEELGAACQKLWGRQCRYVVQNSSLFSYDYHTVSVRLDVKE